MLLFARLYFLVKANFPRHKEAITFPLSSHKHGVLSFYSSSISSLAYPILFFLRGAIIYFNRLFIVYFRQISFITPVYFGKKLSFSRKITVFFCFSAVFLCPIRENFVYYISEAANRSRLYKLLQLFIKTRHFHKKNEINIVTKPILSKILAACLNFFFIFKVFILFCNLILKILR